MIPWRNGKYLSPRGLMAPIHGVYFGINIKADLFWHYGICFFFRNRFLFRHLVVNDITILYVHILGRNTKLFQKYLSLILHVKSHPYIVASLRNILLVSHENTKITKTVDFGLPFYFHKPLSYFLWQIHGFFSKPCK